MEIGMTEVLAREAQKEQDKKLFQEWRGAIVLDDFIGHLFDSENPGWDAFAKNFSIDKMPAAEQERLKIYLNRYLQVVGAAKEAEAAMRGRLEQMGGDQSEARLARVLLANLYKTTISGSASFERQGSLFLLNLGQRADYVRAYNEGEAGEVEVLGNAFFQDTMINLGEQQFPVSVVVVDGEAVRDSQAVRTVLAHERQHLLYREIFRQSEVTPEAAPQLDALKDELLAYMFDGRAPDMIARHLLGYREIFDGLDEAQTEVIKKTIIDTVAALQKFDAAQGVRGHLVRFLLNHEVRSFFKVIEEYAGYFERKFNI